MRKLDLRSDTVTQPTPEMRQAMANAEVGDDIYGDDPTINRLQKMMAEMAGMEDSLFVPSGTFGNQLALYAHCQRGQEIIIGDNNHVLINEAGAPAVIAGVQTRTMPVVNGWMDPDQIEARIRKDKTNFHYPTTGLICIENAHSTGHVMTEQNMKEIYEVGQKYDIPVHCDGARIYNAAVALGVPLSNLTRYVDSISICLSKGLCAPVGSMLVGKKDFIYKALFGRKVMGGAMRQAGVLAAAGIISLETMSKRLDEDHQNAKRLAEELVGTPGLIPHPEDVQINMCFFDYTSEKVSPQEFQQKMADKGIVVNAPAGGSVRMVTHYWITREDVDYIVAAVKEVLS